MHPSVCLSVTFMDSVKTSSRILRLFSPFSSQTILVFPYQTLWQYSDENPRKGGVECRWGRRKSRFLTNIWLSIYWWLLQCAINNWWSLAQCITVMVHVCLWHRPPPIGESCLPHRRLCRREENRTEFRCMHQKSEAEVTNSRRLRSTCCTIEANYWQTWSISVTAGLLVMPPPRRGGGGIRWSCASVVRLSVWCRVHRL